MIYCTYLTTYTGSKMPMFYIGRSNTHRIKNGYHGSVSSKKFSQIWKNELRDNPHLFKTRILTEHQTQKEAAYQEEYFHKAFSVHRNPMYINQATAAGTFCSDIRGKNNPFFGSSRSGHLNPMYGKTHSVEARLKMSRNGRGKHSQPKSAEMKEKLHDLYAGRTYEERFGIDRAALIRAKLGAPKSEKHKQQLKECLYNSNRPKKQCPHCGTLASASPFARFHGDKCKLFTKEIPNP